MTTSPTTRSKSTERAGRLPWRSGRHGQSGYTLLELLLVLLIVTGLAATVWPRFRRASRSLAVRAAARDLVGLTARGRLEALSRREPVEVRVSADTVTVIRAQPRVFDDDGSMWGEQEEVMVLEYPLSPTVAIDRLQVLPADRAFVAGGAEEGLEEPTSDWLSAEEAVITFYPDGTSGDALIGLSDSLADDERSDYYIRVRGLVGRATALRSLRDSDEELFAKVQDAARDW